MILFDFRVICSFTDGRGAPQAPIFFDFRTILISMFAARLQAHLNTRLSSKVACRLGWKPTCFPIFQASIFHVKFNHINSLNVRRAAGGGLTD